MRYYVAVYLRDNQYWKRHKHAFSTLSRAETALQDFVRKARDSLEGQDKQGGLYLKNKVRIFTSYQWDMLAVGYKHPLDRPRNPTPCKTRRVKLPTSQIAEQLRDALRAL